jgi:methyl halide transferase
LTQDLSEKYWNARYTGQDCGWDLGAVSTPLKTYFDQLTDKSVSVLIPGAGNAYEAEYLARLGFENLWVCDFAEAPLMNLQLRCPEIKPARLLQKDFFEIRQVQFDLIIEQTFFCALHPSLRKKYFLKMRELLKPGGRLVGVLFNDVLNSDKPPFGGNKEEYQNYFRDLFTVKVYEDCYNSIPPRAGREIFINLV